MLCYAILFTMLHYILQHDPHGLAAVHVEVEPLVLAEPLDVLEPSYAERLAEYGRTPHRYYFAKQQISQVSIYWYMRDKPRGTAVPSNSRLQTVLV